MQLFNFYLGLAPDHISAGLAWRKRKVFPILVARATCQEVCCLYWTHSQHSYDQKVQQMDQWPVWSFQYDQYYILYMTNTIQTNIGKISGIPICTSSRRKEKGLFFSWICVKFGKRVKWSGYYASSKSSISSVDANKKGKVNNWSSKLIYNAKISLWEEY